jgi:hypothetical protein
VKSIECIGKARFRGWTDGRCKTNSAALECTGQKYPPGYKVGTSKDLKFVPEHAKGVLARSIRRCGGFLSGLVPSLFWAVK